MKCCIYASHILCCNREKWLKSRRPISMSYCENKNGYLLFLDRLYILTKCTNFAATQTDCNQSAALIHLTVIKKLTSFSQNWFMQLTTYTKYFRCFHKVLIYHQSIHDPKQQPSNYNQHSAVTTKQHSAHHRRLQSSCKRQNSCSTIHNTQHCYTGCTQKSILH